MRRNLGTAQAYSRTEPIILVISPELIPPNRAYHTPAQASLCRSEHHQLRRDAVLDAVPNPALV
jgi:hypothetical protein